ncbi:histidinol-phosphatase [Fusobacterium vincentii ATCC 51190]|uniref:UDP-N-acetylmuramoyl-tripeptide--D-alanyl-D-alanine ligase n=1 Tax=Fusobacterium vincentii TaxID=155615 RepID=A0AAJ1FLV9_FUSVC|nr:MULTISPECIES: D-glycero-beta-D-manno-heptose 1,7-bisphosphate 7-phosphatase [Fusobacterium]ETS99050.1 UDP-N-acetylmuramoyl-tripeptide--D-alanyl-D-alanine ligase [Fusobacterium sp. CM21]ALF19172.1 histidinol phosphatase [Fusobacterium vincentii ChDC F8]EJG09178.1 histidinol-phosphatase [Fusobacterium vincentii ATCC 51190]ERT44849.1 UDP-N-acetylmuramoyl-tripeptide-D-alanyl-D-alanine ligase [Fusobacterium nucleatum CTI-7]MCW0263132.1 D-glycero-beta-D-manno-heptose 1,7-bisphosphate 7-phosphatas
MKKAIFLDRDGTINVEKDYIYKSEDLVFEEGSIEALKTFKNLGYILIVVSNQSGIARGYFTEEDLNIFNNNMNEILKKNGVEITEFYCCPHHPDGIGEYKKVCECRKPNNKMIEDAIKKYNINREKSYMIGDKTSDIGAGLKSNLKTVLVKTGYGLKDMEKVDKNETLIYENLKDFSEILKREKLNELIFEEFSKKVQIKNVVMDSRKVIEGSLFFAINNGNSYVKDVLDKGASLVIADNTDIKDKRVIKVTDTIATMQDLATKYRNKLDIQVVGITGSNGKTTTKDIVYSLLSVKAKTLKTEGNYNNHIGLPYTLLNVTDEEKFVVLEMGMSSLGEIRRLGEISSPNYAIITNIGDSHIEFLKTRDNVFKAKTELLEFVDKENTFVCGDDEYLGKLDVNKVGFNGNNTHKIESYDFSNKGSKFILDGKEYEMSLLGKHNISNTAIAIELAKKIGLTDEEIQKGLKEIKISNMRFQEIKIGNDIYINDAYNASPMSMKAAIDTLNEIYNDKYKIAILGDMLELGENEVDYHMDVLNYLLDKKIKLIYLYGERMKKAYDIFMKNKSEEYRFWYYPTKEGIVESLKNIKMDKVILLKASRGIKLEEIIK